MTRFALLAIVFVLGIVLPAAAAPDAKKPSPAPSAAPSAAPRIKTIGDYKAELGLKDEQIEQIKGALATFQKDLTARNNALVQARREYAQLINKHADLAEIKAKLKQIGDLEYEIRVLDVETSRKIETILTPGQLKKWREIQAAARANTNKK